MAAHVDDVIRRHGFELATAAVFFLVGVAYLIDPAGTLAKSPVGEAANAWAYCWSCGYVLAAPAVFYGLFAAKPQHRLAGIVLLGSALAMQGTVAVTAHLELRSFTYFIFALACALRAVYIVRTTPRRR